MVDITATVELAQYETTSDRSNNSEGSLKRVHNYEAELEVILDPHPNLDAYNPGLVGEFQAVADAIDLHAGGLKENEEIVSVSDYSIHGSVDSWVETAEVFASERPSMSTYEVLDMFYNWECTNDRQVSRAMEKIVLA